MIKFNFDNHKKSPFKQRTRSKLDTMSRVDLDIYGDKLGIKRGYWGLEFDFAFRNRIKAEICKLMGGNKNEK